MRLSEASKDALRHISSNPGVNYVEMRNACGPRSAKALSNLFISKRVRRRKGDKPKVWKYWLPHDLPDLPPVSESPTESASEASTDFLIILFLRSNPDSTAKQITVGVGGRSTRKMLPLLCRNGTLSRVKGPRNEYEYRIAVPVGDADLSDVPTFAAQNDATGNPAVVALALRRNEVRREIETLQAKLDELDAAIQLVIEVLE